MPFSSLQAPYQSSASFQNDTSGSVMTSQFIKNVDASHWDLWIWTYQMWVIEVLLTCSSLVHHGFLLHFLSHTFVPFWLPYGLLKTNFKTLSFINFLEANNKKTYFILLSSLHLFFKKVYFSSLMFLMRTVKVKKKLNKNISCNKFAFLNHIAQFSTLW